MLRGDLNEKIHAILLIVLCIGIGNIIYFYPKSNFSPVPTQWGVGSGWGRYYIIEHGRIPEKVHALTWQSEIKNYATVDVLPKILASIVNIVTGTTTFPDNERFHYIFPWCGILFLPLVVLYFYRYISRKEGEFSYIDCCLLYLFAMFPLASTIFSMSQNLNNGSSVTRVFFLLLLILLTILFVEKKKDVRRLSIFLFLLFPFFALHFCQPVICFSKIIRIKGDGFFEGGFRFFQFSLDQIAFSQNQKGIFRIRVDFQGFFSQIFCPIRKLFLQGKASQSDKGKLGNGINFQGTGELLKSFLMILSLIHI